jgi:hypothetical protein
VQGKSISPETTALLTQIVERADRLKALIDATPTETHSNELAREYARFVALSQGVTF